MLSRENPTSYPATYHPTSYFLYLYPVPQRERNQHPTGSRLFTYLGDSISPPTSSFFSPGTINLHILSLLNQMPESLTTLPWDILIEIFGERGPFRHDSALESRGTRGTLCALCLTCQSLLPVARHLLYYEIRLRNEWIDLAHIARTIIRLTRTMVQNPSLRPLVHRLYLPD